MSKLFAILVALCTVFSGVPVAGQTLASKIEYNGTPRFLEVTRLAAAKRSGLLTLFLEITNSDSDDQSAYYRVQWLDEDGFPVWEDEAWKPCLFHGNQTQVFQIAAPTPKAQDFKVQLSADSNWH